MTESPFHILALDSLEKQQALTKQLLNLLKQEYKTLNTNYVDPLDEIISDKQPLIVELDALNQYWLSLIAAESIETSPEGIENFLNDYDKANNTSLLNQWIDLQTMAKDCQKTNTVNGTIIALRYQSAQQTLSILKGQVPGDSTYDPQGNNSPGFSGGSAIAKA